MMLDFNEYKGWRPPVLQVSAAKNQGVDELTEKIIKHKSEMESTGKFKERRERNSKLEILKLVEGRLMEMVLDIANNDQDLDRMAKKVADRKSNPYSIRDEIIRLLRK